MDPEPMMGQFEASPEELLEAVIEALDWANAPTSDDHLDGLARRLKRQPRGYAPAGRVRALYSRERIEANRQRARAERAEEALRHIADGDVPGVTFAEDDLIAAFAREALDA